jgi:phosphatidylinositol-3-phosphatase
VRRIGAVLALAAALVASGCTTAGRTPPSGSPAAPPPAATAASARTSASARASAAGPPDHVVIVVAENKAENDVLGAAPYLTGLASTGARFTQSYAVAHPSEPNYLALFAGSTFGLTDDSCPHTYAADNLAHQLTTAGRTFAGYAESMPADGYTGCSSGRYARKHNPWVNFPDVPATANLTLSRLPADYADLPTVSFVIPDLCGDMHDCPVATGDRWLRDHLSGYATWAQNHRSLLIVTFDEDDDHAGNHILTVFSGEGVRPGSYGERVDHYRVLRTVESLYGLPCLAAACGVDPITDVWR